jgi:hypothetical protein
MAGSVGKRVAEEVTINFPLAYAHDSEEFNQILHHLQREGLIESGGAAYEITVKGLTRVEELQSSTRASRQAFIAMDFSDALDGLRREAIVPAIKEAGFDAYCLKEVEHNDHIDDLMLLEIRKSRFLVAEVSTGNANVHFEAGLAIGAGIPVIWLCSDEKKGQRNFDAEHFNHIFYKDANHLLERLRTRVQATMSPP